MSSAKVGSTTSLNVANLVETALVFNTSYFADSSTYCSVYYPTRLTCPVGQAGHYAIVGTVRWSWQGVGRVLGLGIRLNGTTYLAVSFVPPDTSDPNSSGDVMTVETLWKMNAGDYVELIAYQDTGTTMQIQSTGEDSPALSIMCLND